MDTNVRRRLNWTRRRVAAAWNCTFRPTPSSCLLMLLDRPELDVLFSSSPQLATFPSREAYFTECDCSDPRGDPATLGAA